MKYACILVGEGNDKNPIQATVLDLEFQPTVPSFFVSCFKRKIKLTAMFALSLKNKIRKNLDNRPTIAPVFDLRF